MEVEITQKKCGMAHQYQVRLCGQVCTSPKMTESKTSTSAATWPTVLSTIRKVLALKVSVRGPDLYLCLHWSSAHLFRLCCLCAPVCRYKACNNGNVWRCHDCPQNQYRSRTQIRKNEVLNTRLRNKCMSVNMTRQRGTRIRVRQARFHKIRST